MDMCPVRVCRNDESELPFGESKCQFPTQSVRFLWCDFTGLKGLSDLIGNHIPSLVTACNLLILPFGQHELFIYGKGITLVAGDKLAFLGLLWILGIVRPVAKTSRNGLSLIGMKGNESCGCHLCNSFPYQLQKKTAQEHFCSDMYPLYWTRKCHSKEGFIMRYDYEFKKMCVDLYRQGKWPETPEGYNDPGNFHAMIRRWARAEKANGPQVLKHGKQHPWTPEEKLKLITKVLAGRTAQSVALEAGIESRLLYDWVQKYKIYGYNGLVSKKKGRKSKDPAKMKKVNINNPRKLQESEYEELLRLREENALIKAENEVIKKRIALREEKEAARLKARKQRSSKNSATEDTN